MLLARTVQTRLPDGKDLQITKAEVKTKLNVLILACDLRYDVEVLHHCLSICLELPRFFFCFRRPPAREAHRTARSLETETRAGLGILVE